MRFRLATANIGRKSSVAGVWADLRKIRKVIPNAVVGWQEIDEADPANEHGILKSVFSGYNRLIGMRTKVPVSVPRRRYRIKSKKVIYATSGITHVSPTRWITEVHLVDRQNEAIEFVVLNMHYPAGAWNAKRNERAEEERMDGWNEMLTVHKKRVEYWHKRGITVFWVGDTNRMAMPKVHPEEVRVVTIGIDSISYIEGDVKVKVVTTGHIVLNSDHDGRWVEFNLTI